MLNSFLGYQGKRSKCRRRLGTNLAPISVMACAWSRSSVIVQERSLLRGTVPFIRPALLEILPPRPGAVQDHRITCKGQSASRAFALSLTAAGMPNQFCSAEDSGPSGAPGATRSTR